jgi:dolichol-phosphate mannosyltransferase
VISTSSAFAAVQGLLGARVFARMLASAAGDPVPVATEIPPEAGTLVAIVPALDEAARIGPCLEGLIAQPPALVSIVVVDGGSRDRTREIVRSYAARDARVRLVDAGPAPSTWNGKAWNLSCGLAATDPEARWVVTVDADVRPNASFAASLLAHAAGSYLDAFSAAPLLELSSRAEAAIHPAFLATLVYRYGLPGNVARDVRGVQANGQVFVAKRATLVESGAFAAARASRCDDVTIARHLVARGLQVGFFEGSALASVRMYANVAECWANWPRSLPMRDESTPLAALALQFAEVALVQALPLAVVLTILARGGDTASPLFRVNAALAAARLGVLAGTRRAYANPGAAYWFSVLADGPATVRLIGAAFAKDAVWRGRTLVAPRMAA